MVNLKEASTIVCEHDRATTTTRINGWIIMFCHECRYSEKEKEGQN